MRCVSIATSSASGWTPSKKSPPSVCGSPTGVDSPIAGFIAKRGVGIHHVAFESDDCAGEIQRLAAEDLRLLDEAPRPGAHGTKCAFIHPKSLGSVLTEIVEDPQS